MLVEAPAGSVVAVELNNTEPSEEAPSLAHISAALLECDISRNGILLVPKDLTQKQNTLQKASDHMTALALKTSSSRDHVMSC